MTFSLVQHAHGTTPSGGSPSASYGAGTTAGTTLLAFAGGVCHGGGQVTGITMPAGWADCGDGLKTANSGTSYALGQLFVYLNNPGGITAVASTFTSGGNTSGFLHLWEFSSLTTPALSGHGASVVTSGRPSITLTAAAHDLLFAAMASNAASAFGADGSFVQEALAVGGYGGTYLGEYVLDAPAGSVTANPAAGASDIGVGFLVRLSAVEAPATRATAAAALHNPTVLSTDALSPATKTGAAAAGHGPAVTADVAPSPARLPAAASLPAPTISEDSAVPAPARSTAAVPRGPAVGIVRGVGLWRVGPEEAVGVPLYLRKRTVTLAAAPPEEAIGSPALRRPVILSATPSEEAVGTPTVSGGARGILPAAVGPEERAGRPTLARRVVLRAVRDNGLVEADQAAAFALPDQVGRPSLIPAWRTVRLPAVGPEERVGVPFLFDQRLLVPSSPESFPQSVLPEGDP